MAHDSRGKAAANTLGIACARTRAGGGGGGGGGGGDWDCFTSELSKSVDVPRFSETSSEGKQDGVRVIWLYGDSLLERRDVDFQSTRTRVIVSVGWCLPRGFLATKA